MTLELSSEINLLVTMPVNSSFPAITPLTGTKKNFPDVTGRVNSQPMIFPKRRYEPKSRYEPDVPFSRKDSTIKAANTSRFIRYFGISVCLKTDTGNRKNMEFKSKIPVRKPEMIGNRIESSTKPK